MEILENKGPEEIRAYFEETIDHRTRCDDTCVFHHICPLIRFSAGGKRCPAQNLEPKDKITFINLFLMGDDGVRAEIMRAVYNLARILDLEGDAKSILQYIEVLLKIAKMGDKKPTKEKSQDNEIRITTVQGLPQNTPCIVLPGADSESLYNSPIIDEIMEERRNREE